MAQDIFRLLEKDHREVKSLMDKIAAGGDATERKNVFQKVKDELTAHTQAEEQEFYSLLEQEEETAEKVGHSYEEHEEAARLLEEIAALDPDDEQWTSDFDQLREAVEHHIEEEENDLFPKARRLLGSRSEEIGRRFEASKRDLKDEQSSPRAGQADGNGSHANGGNGGYDISSMTRDELYDRARELGIDGRSKMTKRELAEAVRARS